jgi:hypothetical protein
VGGVTLELPPPSGYCEADASSAVDRPLFDYMNAAARPGTRLLTISAECGQLIEWRTGRRPALDNYAQHHTITLWENTPLPAPPAALIDQTCTALRSQGGQVMSQMGPDIKDRIERALKDVKVNEFKFMGVLGQDPNACYASLVARMRMESGEEIEQASVFATTIVRGKVIYYILYARFVNADTLTGMLAQLRGYVAELEAATRN